MSLRFSRRKEDFDSLHEMEEEGFFYTRVSPVLREIMEDHGLITKSDVISFCYNGFYNLYSNDMNIKNDIDVALAILECMDLGLISIKSLSERRQGHSYGEFVVYLGRLMDIIYFNVDRDEYERIWEEVQDKEILIPEVIIDIYENHGWVKDIENILFHLSMSIPDLFVLYDTVQDLSEKDKSYELLLTTIISYVNDAGLTQDLIEFEEQLKNEANAYENEEENTDVETQ